MRTLILKHVARNVATRMIFMTGLAGIALMTLDGLLHNEAFKRALGAPALPADVQQQGLLVLSLLLFFAAHRADQVGRPRPRRFLALMNEFWQFNRQVEPSRAYRLLEWAHLALIVLMFHRALFL